MHLTGRSVLVLLVGLVPVVLLGRRAEVAFAVLGLWLLIWLILVGVDLAVAGSARAVALERRTPDRVRLGERAEATLLITNTGRRRITGVVRDAWEPSAGALATRSPLRLPPGERRAVRTVLEPRRRGERRALHATIRSNGVLGLAGRQATLAAPAVVRVLPPFRSRRHLPSRLARLRELEGRTSVMIRGQGTEFDSLREYVRGDDVRSLDWRATARRREPVVRTWRPERDRRVVLVLDTGRTSAARIDDEPRLDTAIEASLLLSALAASAGDRIDVLAFDRARRARVHGATGTEVLSRVVDALAPVQPQLIETDWSAVPGQVRTLVSQRSLVVLLTALDSVGASEGLLAVLPQLTRQHTVVVACAIDPELARMAADRGDRGAVYAAAAAERSLADADRLAAAVRRLGGDVVLASPEKLPPALADRYLALKATGRL
ncbi:MULTISPECIES: DUF58 domain-containing protein [unclassified Rathayibacter]|uniref:DUF58 domain-containing protein n=1 Tax=unclassified Rathayibacter TaxID=2609250 RepID=UPI0010533883|nr:MULTISPECIES: DUF58 domain-containing protein [unclassified Rathayibacter]MCJ1704818.1 DUF58 domain-containing protein [Rathayibacter sp. VKM Ac-2926]TCL84566.1 uncharacterized protein (DUF58 family) [Rathayibacter sp. PhB192]TCM30284.1 uncharacterized protein (DUF58 family) [Rathayibacter sp. PhB179]